MKRYESKFKKVFENSYSNYIGKINFNTFSYPEDDNDVWNVWQNFVKPLLKKEFTLVNDKKDDSKYIYIKVKDKMGNTYSTTVSKDVLFTMSPKKDALIFVNDIKKQLK